jgi:hypothetical protein
MPSDFHGAPDRASRRRGTGADTDAAVKLFTDDCRRSPLLIANQRRWL